jgi:hypothetical protein
MGDECNFCFNLGCKMGEGGQSYLYKNINDNNTLIRTIPIPVKWEKLKMKY